jgi:hypothetical protein
MHFQPFAQARLIAISRRNLARSALANVSEKVVSKTLPTWWIKYRGIRESTGETDIEKARKYLARRAGEVATGKFSGLATERTTIAELLKDLEEDYILNNRKDLPIF